MGFAEETCSEMSKTVKVYFKVQHGILKYPGVGIFLILTFFFMENVKSRKFLVCVLAERVKE